MNLGLPLKTGTSQPGNRACHVSVYTCTYIHIFFRVSTPFKRNGRRASERTALSLFMRHVYAFTRWYVATILSA